MRQPLLSALGLISIVTCLGALAGCGGTATDSGPRILAQSSGLQAQVASSDLSVGLNRFTFGLLSDNRPVKGGRARITFFVRSGNTAIRMTSGVAQFNYFARNLKNSAANAMAIELGGVFVVNTRFSRPGDWGAEIQYRLRGVDHVVQTSGFTVARHSLSPAVGSAAPRSNNPTIFQMPATRLDSGSPPDDMHRLSIRQAIGMHKPLVVLFATPAYCESRLCGPETQEVVQLENTYRGRVNFVHIEIYKNANPQDGYAPTVIQWGLRTEPWVFVVNRRGIITAKFQGPTPGSELRPAIDRSLA